MAWARRLEPVARERDASFFEITTAIAFADFAARGVEIAVVEVGLGGRLDATNVIEPLACGVTRIALEHAEYLGSDLKGIGREKAGIAKPGVPFLTTETNAGVLEAMRETVDSQQFRVGGVAPTANCRLLTVDPDLAAGYRLGLKGPHQVANASLALALAGALPEPWRPDAAAMKQGLASARIPGRFDRRGPWIFDVAHNPDGMRALTAALQAEAVPRPLIAVVAVLKDKDWRGMLEVLAPAVDGLVLTLAPSAPAERAWTLDEVERWAIERNLAARAEPELQAALGRAREMGASVLVCGSFHTVGDALSLLPGFSPPD